MRGFKLRLFPTKEQVISFWQAVGTARWVWNWGVAYNRNLYASEKRTAFEYELKKEFTKVRNSGEFPWLKEVAAKVPAVTLMMLGRSYRQCFAKQKKGLEAGLPKFKAKGTGKDSFGLDASTVRFYENGVSVSKIGRIRFKSNIPLKVLRSTKIYNPRIAFVTGKWILSLALPTNQSSVISSQLKERVTAENLRLSTDSYTSPAGIDLGVKTLAVVSCGGKIYKAKNINRSYRVVRRIKQQAHQQRALARRKKGSKNRKKALHAVRQCHRKLANIRKDYIHKVTRKIIDLNPKVIILEDLNVQGMMKNRHLARAVAEQNFYRFREFIEYKAEERGIKVRFADRFYPSSKTCSCCGYVLKELKLSDRIYRCPQCGLTMDRDENAARNLEKAV